MDEECGKAARTYQKWWMDFCAQDPKNCNIHIRAFLLLSALPIAKDMMREFSAGQAMRRHDDKTLTMRYTPQSQSQEFRLDALQKKSLLHCHGLPQNFQALFLCTNKKKE